MTVAIAGVAGVLTALGAAYGRRHGRRLVVWLSVVVQLAVLAAVVVIDDGTVGLAVAAGVGLFVITYVVSDISVRTTKPDGSR